MFCKNCGNELKDGVKFCSKCGAKFDTNSNATEMTSSSTVSGVNCFVGHSYTFTKSVYSRSLIRSITGGKVIYQFNADSLHIETEAQYGFNKYDLPYSLIETFNIEKERILVIKLKPDSGIKKDMVKIKMRKIKSKKLAEWNAFISDLKSIVH